MIELIQNIILFPWWVFSTFFVYGFGLVAYYMLYKALEMYVPWENLNDLPNYRELFSKEKK